MTDGPAPLDRRLHAVRPDLADERLRERVSSARFAAGVARQVLGPSAPLRRNPRQDAVLDTEALAGEAVLVFDDQEGWSWVQLQTDGYVGYVPSDALGPAGPAPTHRVSALRTFVFPGPDLKLPPISHFPMCAGITPLDGQGEYVRLASGGWVFGGHLAPADEHAPDFVAVAERLLGTPYLWGGKTSLGLDCSGLLQLSLALAGMAAPRDTDLQRNALGTPVEIERDLSGLRRGDLVFWPGHVGIMRDGATLLHANAHHMAVASEPLMDAETRIRARSFGPIAAIRRLAPR